MKKLILAGISFIFVQFLLGQTWSAGQMFGGTGNNQAFFLECLSDDELVMGGLYEKALDNVPDWPPSKGNRDIFLATYGADRQISSIVGIGGAFREQLWALDTDGKRGLVVAGQYTVEASIDTFLFRSDPFPTATFVARFNGNLELEWWVQLVGTGIVEVSDLEIGALGEIYVTGTFQDSMWWNDELIVAKGSSDMFVARMDPLGNLDWVRHFGQSGDTRTTAMDERDGVLLLAGVFNDQTSFGGAGMTANTKDLDVFLLTMDGQTGSVKWAVKAGGVFDEEVSRVLIDEAGSCYAFGQLIGVMNISPDQSIQSSTGQSDLFVLKYSPSGVPLIAKAFNAPGPQLAADMELSGTQLIVTGYYQNELSLPPFELGRSDNYNGFVASLGQNDLTPTWLLEAVGSNGVYPSDLLIGRDEIWLLGNFSGQMDAGQIQLSGISQSDIFLMEIQTSTALASIVPLSLDLFPNPAAHTLNIRTPYPEAHITLYSNQGVQVLRQSVQYEATIEIAGWTPGQYWLLLRYEDRLTVAPVVITR